MWFLAMLSSYYIERKRKLDLSTIYVKPGDNGRYVSGYNLVACVVMAISFIFPMSGAFFTNVPLLATLNQFAFFSGLILSFVLYTLCYRLNKSN
ncbi:hypothetical protein [Brevibacillus centrosporus]|uniref:hypothetical protein n=1 Tax=Brevibacillus centrosporus TaxID=54910 RepID=UPI003985BCBE